MSAPEFKPFPRSGYGLIYADPPWAYRDKANAGKRGACHKYGVLSMNEIAQLDVQSIAAPDCVLAMWWVPPQPAEALALVEAWGFRLITMKGIEWIKTTKRGKFHFGMGHWTRANAESVLLAGRGAAMAAVDDLGLESESLLLAKRGKPRAVSHSVHQLVFAERGAHSAKPPEVADRLVELVGPVKRIELFARMRRDASWDYWGDQV